MPISSQFARFTAIDMAVRRQAKIPTNSFITYQEVTMSDPMKRLPEFKRLAPNASQKVLLQQLREMEEHGLLEREIFRQVPPRVDYTATALGLSLEPVIMSLCDWGRRHAAELGERDPVLECVVGRPARRVAPSPPVAPAGSASRLAEQRKVSRATNALARSS